ncbi:MAG: DsbA family protein [Gammaproteobacteria bacterium]|nr:DsbA family protein [Gammaproteobacteria bacterium]
MTEKATLYYAHDPMCSWCWAFAPAWEALRESFGPDCPDRLQIRKLLGGLAPDSDEPMPEPMQHYLQQTWSAIRLRVPGTRFNFDFWTRCRARRSTWPACRAVIAARGQGGACDDAMVRAVQRAYYLDARNPSDRDTLVALAGEIGLDAGRFETDLDSAETRAAHDAEMGLVQRLGVRGFPSLVLADGGRAREIEVSFTEPDRMREQVLALLRPR